MDDISKTTSLNIFSWTEYYDSYFTEVCLLRGPVDKKINTDSEF